MKSLKIFLSEATRSRALIFGMQHHLVDLYQVYSIYAPIVEEINSSISLFADDTSLNIVVDNPLDSAIKLIKYFQICVACNL